MKLSELRLNPDNPQTYTDLSKLKASVKEFPKMLELRPVVYDPETMFVLGGNKRLIVMQELGFDELDPAWVRSAADLSEDEKKRFVIADNVGFGEWDWDALQKDYDLGDLNDWGLEAPKFNTVEEGQTDPDFAPSVPPDPTTCRGDIFQLGEHRLMCGDSTVQTDMDALCAGELARMWLTDPPYNVDYQGGTEDSLTIENDSMDNDSFRQFLRDSYGVADSVMKPGAVFYIWHADMEGFNFRAAAVDTGWKVRQLLIWMKSSLVMGRQDYQSRHEPCLYGWKEGAAHYWANDRKQTTILEFDKPSRNGEHPTMKPMELFSYQMLNNTDAGDLVLDSFGGSGTTLMAAQVHGRRACIMEFDPKYCDVIIKRWQDFTGETAVLLNGAES